MHRPSLAATALVIAGTATLVPAQTPATDPASLKFEVAMLKPSPPGGRGGGVRPAPGGERYVATNAPLRLMIQVAYRLRREQIAGGPDWIDTDTYDMNAKAERPSTTEELHFMLQNLLVDRFKLRFHLEKKEMPMYALTVDKNGPKMEAHQATSAGDPWIDQTLTQVVRMNMTAKFVPMDYFAWRLGLIVDRPVIDRTNLKGGYDFVLNFTRDLPLGIPEGAKLNGEPIDTSGPNIFKALRQQLGLNLEAQKGPVETMVIDHVEKPIEN
jgi:uncharacterized protein (TIGR03435 family)